MSDIKKAQRKDPTYQKIYDHLKGSKLADTQKEGHIIWQAQNLILDPEGVLMKPTKAGVMGRNRLFLPSQKLQQRVIQFFHDDLTARQQSIQLTLERLFARYWWEDKAMKDVVGKHVEGCQSCTYNKVKVKKLSTGLKPMPISSPWRDIHMDVCEFERPSGKNRHVLVIVDWFIKYVELEESEQPTFGNILRAFENCILYRHGHPSTVVTDNAKYFKKFGTYLESRDIEHVTGQPYRHTTNGLAKRMIKSIREFLRHYLNTGDDQEFPLMLAAAKMALNTQTKTSHGTTPYLRSQYKRGSFERTPRKGFEHGLGGSEGETPTDAGQNDGKTTWPKPSTKISERRIGGFIERFPRKYNGHSQISDTDLGIYRVLGIS